MTNLQIDTINIIKDNIRKSRYSASKAVNRELIILYFSIGKTLSDTVSAKDWGSKILTHISNEIQYEFKGIRGFSVRNLKNMRQFYEEYSYIPIGQLTTAQLRSENPSIGIILCKEKSRSIVEFAFKYTNAPVGVATYKLDNKLPAKLKKYLPSEKVFQEFLENQGGDK